MARWAACSTLLLLATCVSACKLNDPSAAATGSPYTVSALGLNCHDGADLHTPVREQLPQNAAVNVVRLDGAWAELHREGWDCWVKTQFITPANGPNVVTQPGEVALVDDGGGTFRVPVQLDDGLTVKFTIDSGASDVTIPADVASVMFRQGVITQDDFIGEQTFTLADGSTMPSKEFRLKTLKVGDIVLQDVTVSISPANSDPLLGQSFLSRLASWSLDNSRHVLLLNQKPDAAPTPVPLTTPVSNSADDQASSADAGTSQQQSAETSSPP